MPSNHRLDHTGILISHVLCQKQHAKTIPKFCRKEERLKPAARSMENVYKVFQTSDVKIGVKDYHFINNLVKVE